MALTRINILMNSSIDTVFNEARHRDVVALSEHVFGRTPERVAFPGGKSRSAFVADMGDALYVFARRKTTGDARLESTVLRCLGKTGHTPRLKARFDEWVVQEFLPGQRLPVVLDEMTSMEERGELVSKALESLLHVQKTAMAVGLQDRLPEIGVADDWVWNRTGAAKRMSKQMGIAAPKLNREWLTNKLTPKRTEFIKWDARPGNAMVDGAMVDGAMVDREKVVWFDWEACGRGCGLDDLAVVLCDEWTCLDAATEKKLEERFLPLFNRTKSPEEAREYFRLFGVTHTVIRLRMALKLRLRDGKWWSRSKCLAGDKIGVTPTETARLVERGKRLAEDVPQLRPYVNWFNEVADHFDIPSCDNGKAAEHAA